MRRAVASLLLAMFSFPLIAAALYAGEAASVPACCRRSGKHHCEMAETSSASDGPTVTPTKCASWPGVPIASFGSGIQSAAPAIVVAPHFSVYLRVAPNAGEPAGAAAITTLPQRGPPFQFE
jgi:hypothetical protein